MKLHGRTQGTLSYQHCSCSCGVAVEQYNWQLSFATHSDPQQNLPIPQKYSWISLSDVEHLCTSYVDLLACSFLGIARYKIYIFQACCPAYVGYVRPSEGATATPELQLEGTLPY